MRLHGNGNVECFIADGGLDASLRKFVIAEHLRAARLLVLPLGKLARRERTRHSQVFINGNRTRVLSCAGLVIMEADNILSFIDELSRLWGISVIGGDHVIAESLFVDSFAVEFLCNIGAGVLGGGNDAEADAQSNEVVIIMSLLCHDAKPKRVVVEFLRELFSAFASEFCAERAAELESK